MPFGSTPQWFPALTLDFTFMPFLLVSFQVSFEVFSKRGANPFYGRGMPFGSIPVVFPALTLDLTFIAFLHVSSV